MKTAAHTLAAFTSGLTRERIPPDVLDAAKLHLLDTLGCGLAAHALDVAPYAREVTRELAAEGPATVIGLRDGAPAQDAAFANGTLCHALDFDDTHPPSVSHISAVVAPAALATGDTLGADGASLLTAIVAGNEVTMRVGMAASEAFHARGFHPTAVCGVFGATAAAARLRGLDEETTTQALGIAGSLASGVLEFLADGSSTKRLHPGFAARAGVLAAALAAHGATGPATVLEGRFGLYRTFLGRDDVDVDAAIADLGSVWETPRIAFKPYPACHYVHAALDATIAAVSDAGLGSEEIEEIVVVSPPAGVNLVLEPAEGKARPRSEYEAKFSLPFAVASYLRHGRVDVTSFTDAAIADEDVLALTPMVRYEVKEFETAGSAFPGGARVRATDGRVIERELLYQRGDPNNPMSDADVREKYRANAGLGLDPDDVSALEAAVNGLERLPDTSALRMLGHAAARVAA
jgi:2-methylcitrate dehydratase PrpD